MDEERGKQTGGINRRDTEGAHEEVSCQREVRGWNACAYGREGAGSKGGPLKRRKEEKGQDSLII